MGRPSIDELRRLSIATLLLFALPAASAPAAQQSAAAGTAHEGIVSASLVYEQTGAGAGGLTLSNLDLEISRAGRPFYDRPLRSRLCGSSCLLETADGGPLLVNDLEGNHQPDVVLELNSGGAHCCSIVQIFAFDPGVMTDRPIEHNFRDAGALLTDVSGDGLFEFESADDRFAYEFAPFAYSGLPLQIWRFHDGRLRDATREFPRALTADASRQLGRFRANRPKGLGLGFIAAWAGDEYLLGHRALVSSTLAGEARDGRLRSRDRLSPGGPKFIANLKQFLKRNGYG